MALCRLQEENARLSSRFSFTPGDMPVSDQFGGGISLAPRLPEPLIFPTLVSTQLENVSSFPSLPSFSNDFMTESALSLFSPPLPLASSSNTYFSSLNGASNLTSDFTAYTSLDSPNYPGMKSATSPEHSSTLVDDPVTPSHALYSPRDSTYRDGSYDMLSANYLLPTPASPLPSLVTSTPNVDTIVGAGAELGKLPCHEKYDFDLNGLCAEYVYACTIVFEAVAGHLSISSLCSMKNKATCEEMARAALKASMEEDSKSIAALYP